jgi:hypothetical protein
VGWFCEIRAFCEIRDRREVILHALALEAALAVLSTVGDADDFFDVANAEAGEIGSFGQDLSAKKALGLETAEFGGRLIKMTAGLGTGTVDGGLTRAGRVVVIERREG